VEPHLNSSQIEELLRLDSGNAEGVVDRGNENARIHLNTCEICQCRLRAEQEAVGRLAPLKAGTAKARGPLCPSEELWLKVASGVAPHGSETYISHASECDHCGPLLREAAEDFLDELTPSEEMFIAGLKSATPEWHTSLVSKLIPKDHLSMPEEPEDLLPRGSPSGSKAGRGWLQPVLAAVSPQMRWAAAACLALLVITAAILARREGTSAAAVDRLLAQAYADQRTFDLRVAGAPYAPLRQERGAARSVLEKPESLLQAEYEIKKGLAARPEDAALLAAEGRAELLEWQYDEALKSLQHALDINPNSASILSDLAVAYTQRGDEEDRPIDYGQAIEFLGRALRKEPDNKVALFNRAVVEERLDLLEDAGKDLEAYLRLDPRSDWAAEARQRLEEVRRKQKTSAAQPSAEIDPLRAIPNLERRANGANHGPPWPESLDEDYLSIAVADWLPSVASTLPASAKRTTPAWSALKILAEILGSLHQDRWLADVLSARLSPRLLDGWNELALAVQYNAEGNFDSAAQAASQAETLLKGNSRAAFLRALWEHAYALQRSQQGAPCLRVLKQATGSVDLQHYPWISAQLLLEHSICSAMVGQMGDTKSRVTGAISIADSAQYATLLLRTYHIMGIQAASQNPDDAWRWFLKGLNRHWAGSYRPFRMYQFCSEMSLTAEHRGQWHLARSLMDEGVTHIAHTPDRLMEAIARYSLAIDTQMAGYTTEALETFRQAADLFASLPQTPSVKASQFAVLVYQASLLAQQGNDDAALHTLDIARTHFSEQSQYWTWLHYYEALGEALLQHGNDSDAECALNAAVRISESALATIGDESDRTDWERQTMGAYRSLVELTFEREHDPSKALEIWEWYIAAPIRIPKSRAPKPDIDFSLLESHPVLPRLDRVEIGLADLRDVTVISFAELRDGPVAWIFDNRGIEAARLKVSTTKLNQTAARFARLCSDPSSDLGEIHEVGSQLYDWLLAPFELRLDPTRELAIEADGPLKEVPFDALTTAHGRWFSQNHTLVNSSGLGYRPLRHHDPNFSRNDRMLAVGASSGAPRFKKRMPFLPDSGVEAQNISLAFPHSRLLVGNQATIEAVRRDLAVTRVFHFAGHAITSSTGSGLLFEASSTADGGEVSAPGFLNAQAVAGLPLRTVDLVVLSACTTGGVDSEYTSPHGLAQAFLRAGVPYVVASRWDVDSVSTRIFMEEFYKYLTTGRSPAAALGLTAEAIRARSESQHPYYWAAFTAFGLN
jgi:CHAT domain-containing protein/tetratricopeptide (TPR) repeat protein